MATLLNPLLFLFKISFLYNYCVNYYDYIVKCCSGIAGKWCVSLDIDLCLALTQHNMEIPNGRGKGDGRERRDGAGDVCIKMGERGRGMETSCEIKITSELVSNGWELMSHRVTVTERESGREGARKRHAQ